MIKVKESDIKREIMDDYSPDLSWLGEFTDNPPHDKIVIQHNGGPREYKFFVPTNAETQEQAQQDYDRIMGLYLGHWHMMGIRAKIEVHIPIGTEENPYWQIQNFNSAGLWGIESDSDEEYFEEVFREEKSQLLKLLSQLCIEVV